MSEGVYLSRGKSAEHIKAEREAHDALMASEINVPMSVQAASDGGEAATEVFELLEDVGRGLDFVSSAIRSGFGGADDPGLQGILSVMAVAIRMQTESSDHALRELARAANKAGAAAQLEAMK